MKYSNILSLDQYRKIEMQMSKEGIVFSYEFVTDNRILAILYRFVYEYSLCEFGKYTETIINFWESIGVEERIVIMLYVKYIHMNKGMIFIDVSKIEYFK